MIYTDPNIVTYDCNHGCFPPTSIGTVWDRWSRSSISVLTVVRAPEDRIDTHAPNCVVDDKPYLQRELAFYFTDSRFAASNAVMPSFPRM